MARPRPLIVHGVEVLVAELPEGLEANGRLGSRRRPGARVYVRPELVTSPRLPALVAVASLGAAPLARAEAIVAETWPGARLVWRVESAQKIRDEHFANNGTVTGASVLRVVAARASVDWLPMWPEECPFAGSFGTPSDDRHGVHRAWPALRALAALGLHLVDLDAGRVVLAVEAPCPS